MLLFFRECTDVTVLVSYTPPSIVHNRPFQGASWLDLVVQSQDSGKTGHVRDDCNPR
jgi:hypothetical protein